MGRILKNHIKTTKEFKTLYKKDTGVLLKIILNNNKKKKLKIKKLVKGNG